MRNSADIIVELRSTNSRLAKEEIIEREMIKHNTVFFRAVTYALDKLITFGVKQVPTKTDDGKNHLDYMEFFDVLEQLKTRQITGNDAREKINEMMQKSSQHLWNNFYRLILIKDFKCGVSEKTINNCAKKVKCEDYKVPVFSCQLASPSEKHEKKMKGKKMVDVKLDGVRLLTVVYPSGEVLQFTRNGKEVHNFPKIKQEFSLISNKLSEPMVFDGEIVSGSFQDLMTTLFAIEDVDTHDAVLYLFDKIPLKAFSQGFYGTAQITRREDLLGWYNSIKEQVTSIKALEYQLIDLSDKYGEEDLLKFNRWALQHRYEGIMVKDLNAPYECTRTTSWLKIKPVMTLDLVIVDLLEGEPDSKYSNTLGAISCHGIDDEKEIFVNVGSGLSDSTREKYWANKDQVIGKIAEIECDAITQNQDGGYSLRFPRFKRLRGFDIKEKI